MFALYYMTYFKPNNPDSTNDQLSADEVSCFYPRLWFVIFTNVSSFFMTINASLGFFIYCVGCQLFRAELKLRFEQFREKVTGWQRTILSFIAPEHQPEVNF